VLDSYAERSFEATLVKVYPEADRQKGTVKIEVQITKPDRQIIKPEMSVKVSFLANHAANADEPRLIVPKSSVKVDGEESYVWMVRNGVASRAAIVRGREMETGVEVKQGIREGDVVIIASATVLKEGQKVRMEQSPQ
jgi:membrane fusion protein (multidrug efflux system)